MSDYSFSDAAIQDLDEICEYIARSCKKIVGWVEALRNPTFLYMLGCAPLHPTYV